MTLGLPSLFQDEHPPLSQISLAGFQGNMKAIPKKRSGRILHGLLFLLLAACSQSALAQVACWTNGPTTYNLRPPASVVVPRDTAPGTKIMDWVYANASGGIWGCNIGGGVVHTLGSKISWTPFAAVTSHAIPGPDGAGLYNVFTTNVPGVGIAYAGRTHFSYCGAGWYPWNNYGTSLSGGTSCNTNGRPEGQQVGFGHDFAFALVKIGAVSNGQIAAQTIATGAAIGAVPNQPGTYYNISAINISVAQCSTPDVTVNLGNFSPREFTGIGTVTREVNFDISLNNCDAWMNTIDYTLQPTTAVVASPGWHFQLDSSSSARGVGIQILYQSNSSIVPLNTKVRFPSYNRTVMGSYKIPMKARYIQTGAAVTPGTANGLVYFTMTYL